MLDAMMNRRSIRQYKPDMPSEEQLHLLLEAAMAAPTACNGQPWHFIVCTDRAVLDQLHNIHPYAGMLKQAPVCIAVCADKTLPFTEFYQQDCAAATENILVAACELGLGACWVGVAPMEQRMQDIRTVLAIPEHILPFNLIALGYPAEEKPRAERYQQDKVHMNRW